MQWVKASERMPVAGDKTSVDAWGTVIYRFMSQDDYVASTCEPCELTDDPEAEWLEGWNVEQETTDQDVYYTVSDFKIARWWYVLVAGAAGAILGRTIGDAIETVLVWWGW